MRWNPKQEEGNRVSTSCCNQRFEDGMRGREGSAPGPPSTGCADMADGGADSKEVWGEASVATPLGKMTIENLSPSTWPEV